MCKKIRPVVNGGDKFTNYVLDMTLVFSLFKLSYVIGMFKRSQKGQILYILTTRQSKEINPFEKQAFQRHSNLLTLGWTIEDCRMVSEMWFSEVN